MARVVGFGYHDVHLRFDLTTPQAVTERLRSLPHMGDWPNVGSSLWAERDRFGKWQHLLGEHQLRGYVVDHPTAGRIARLEVQTHLGGEGEDNLVPPAEFPIHWSSLERRMALYGVLPPGEPRVTRVDVAVDVEFDDPAEGMSVLEGLRFARWPNGWYTEHQGAPPYTTVAIKAKSKTVARVYCRNTKTRNGGPRWGKLRFERERTIPWVDGRGVEELESETFAQTIWESAFGAGRASGRVTRIPREVQTMTLIERVRLGELTYAQFERMTAFLDAERLGLLEQVYSPEMILKRRREAKQLGISQTDAEYPEFDAALDDLLAVPRAAFAA